MKMTLILLFISQLLLFGCKKDENIPASGTPASTLIGTWNLSQLKVAGVVTDPNTKSDVLVKIVVNSDSSGQTFWADRGSINGNEAITLSVARDSLNLRVNSSVGYKFWFSLNSNMLVLRSQWELRELTYQK
jgi:uncharacterized membrane protein